jgi:hypothetical protein
MDTRTETAAPALQDASSASAAKPKAPKEEDWETLALALKEVTEALTTRRHILAVKTKTLFSFKWFLQNYALLSSSRALSIYNLIVKSKSPILFEELTKRRYLTAFLINLLTPDLAESYLYDLLKLMTNSKISNLAQSFCAELLQQWTALPSFNGPELQEQLYKKINLSTSSSNTKIVLLAQLKRLELTRFAPLREEEMDDSEESALSTPHPEEISNDTLELTPPAPQTTIIFNEETPALAYFENIFKHPDSKDAMLPLDWLNEEEDGLEPLYKKAKF